MAPMRTFPTAARLTACGAALVVGLASCAQAPAPGVQVPAITSGAAPTPTSSWLSEAPVVITVGQASDLSGTRGLAKAVVTVASVTENATCPTGAAQPKNAQFVEVKLSAKRLDTAANFGMAVYDWFTTDAAGKETAADAGLVTGLCITDGTALKLAYDPSGATAGTVLLDAPANVVSILARNTAASPPVTVTIEMPAR